MLYFDDESPYATGAAPYAYRPVTEQETTNRIIVTVSIEGFETSAFVDTGGIFLVSPEVAQSLNLDPDDGMPAVSPIRWRGHRLKGVLHRVGLTFLAIEGDSLEIEATAFVPHSTPDQEWLPGFPCILGMHNCLDRLRFAIDPSDDIFYFGELTAK